MPRVSDAYVARRRREVLDAALRCFARNGFQATSMDEVIAESGMSAGTVYRWYRGKDDLIAAAVGDVLGRVGDALEQLAVGDPTPDAAAVVDAVLATLTAPGGLPADVDPARLAVLAWAEALHTPGVHELLAGRYRSLHDSLVAVLKRSDVSGRLPPAADLDAVASVLFALAPGYMVHRLLVGGIGRDAFVAAVAAVLGGAPAGSAEG